jgi:hypothetical protein
MISSVRSGSEVPGGLVGSSSAGSLTSAQAMTTALLTAGELEGRLVTLCWRPTSFSIRSARARASGRGTPSTSSARATLSSTVRWGSSLKSWNTTPMFRRRKGTLPCRMRATFRPPTRI